MLFIAVWHNHFLFASRLKNAFSVTWRLWDRASLEQRCKQPTRCNKFRLLIFLLIFLNQFYVFRATRWVSFSPETSRADVKRSIKISIKGICCILLVAYIVAFSVASVPLLQTSKHCRVIYTVIYTVPVQYFWFERFTFKVPCNNVCNLFPGIHWMYQQ